MRLLLHKLCWESAGSARKKQTIVKFNMIQLPKYNRKSTKGLAIILKLMCTWRQGNFQLRLALWASGCRLSAGRSPGHHMTVNSWFQSALPSRAVRISRARPSLLRGLREGPFLRTFCPLQTRAAAWMDETQSFLFCHLGRCFLSLVIDMCSRRQKYSLKNFHLIYSPLCEVKAWEVVTIPFPRAHWALD